MKDTKGYRLTLTRHACSVAARKGVTAPQIMSAFESPVAVVENTERPGQFKVISPDLIIMGAPVSKDEFRGITMKVRDK